MSIIIKMMKKVMMARALLGSGSRRVPLMISIAQQARLSQAVMMLPVRGFHAGGPPGHTHDEEDDGKESHSDFKAKAKKGPLSEEELNK
jgi:hypothetical protein